MSGLTSPVSLWEGAQPRAVDLSVVVCVYNRATQILKCLESIAGSTHPSWELIAVDDGSTDTTGEILERFREDHPEVSMRVMRNATNLGLSAARNIGTRVAHGRYILFTDSDCVVSPQWIEALSTALQHQGVAAAAGLVLEPPPRNLAEQAFHGTTRIGSGMGQRRRLVGNNMGFDRHVLASFEFDESLSLYCDDDDLGRRLSVTGHRIAFVPQAKVLHDHRLDLASYLRMGYWQGIASARYWYKHGQYLGRDVIALVLCLVLILCALIDERLLGVAATLFVVQLCAMLFAEMAYKGKSLVESLTILPIQLLYICSKLAGVIRTWLCMATGREGGITHSKRRWRAELDKSRSQHSH